MLHKKRRQTLRSGRFDICLSVNECLIVTVSYTVYLRTYSLEFVTLIIIIVGLTVVELLLPSVL